MIAFPALNTAGVPFVRIVSCNPLDVKGAGIAPAFSGYPADDRSGWDAFRAEYDRTHRPMWEQFNEWVVAQGAQPLPDLEFIHEGDLNLFAGGARSLDGTGAGMFSAGYTSMLVRRPIGVVGSIAP
ncbi:hypothetical protein ACIA5C_17040 [Actinoplanes sp. NPDC051343]|uniref:hypothetical protein n=1 Tax=Actinoplanes sp. NPDC051343 TaxID=3363906 RepID=UPI0037B792F3